MQIREGYARTRGLAINYQDMGDPNDPAVLLVMGLGAQLLLWRTEFCERLVNQGLRVIRYDNRDVGLSTKLDGQMLDQPFATRMLRSFAGLRSAALYTLEDMADDAAALLDHLEIEGAHVVGASMGGMIAQIFAARHAHRTPTLAVIMSSNNQAFLPPPGLRQLKALLQKPKDSSREAVVENAVRVSKIIGSPSYRQPEADMRADVREGYDRCYYPAGFARQFGAVLGSGSLLRYNQGTTAPTVVIHGKADRLMRPSGGRAVARGIPGARLVLYDGMGHDLPEPLWDHIIGELKNNFAAQAP